MTKTLLTKDFVESAFKDHIQFDTQPSREYDEIEILSISEPFTDPKDASRTCFDVTANIYKLDENNNTIETLDHEVSYTLYFDQDGCCVQVDAY